MRAESLPSRLAAAKRLVTAFGNTVKCLQNTLRSFEVLAKALHHMASTEPLDYRSSVLNGAANARHFEDLFSEMAIALDAGRRAFLQISKSVTKRAMSGFKAAEKLSCATVSAQQANEIISAYTDFEEEHIRALRSCFDGMACLAKAAGQTALSTDYLAIASCIRPDAAKAITTNRYRGLVKEVNTVNGASTLIQDQLARQHDENIVSTGEYIFGSQGRSRRYQASNTIESSNIQQGQYLSAGHRVHVLQLPD